MYELATLLLIAATLILSTKAYRDFEHNKPGWVYWALLATALLFPAEIATVMHGWIVRPTSYHVAQSSVPSIP